MADIDDFATQLLEEAKRFVEKAKDFPGSGAESANLHAALILGFCALEAHVNAMALEIELVSSLTIHERALLLERDVRLVNGVFEMGNGLKMAKLEDRIQLLHRLIPGKQLDREVPWWSALGNAVALRNELTHPKAAASIRRDAVERALQAIVDTVNSLYLAVYGRKFPAASLGLQSRLTF